MPGNPYSRPRSTTLSPAAWNYEPRITPTEESWWDKTRDKLDEWKFPLIGGDKGVGTGLEGMGNSIREMITDPEGEPFNFLNPMQMPAAVAAGWIPKKLAREFGLKTGRKDAERIAKAGYPKIAEVVETMSKKHPVVVGHTRGFDLMDVTDPKYNPRHGAQYRTGDIEGAQSILLAAGRTGDDDLYDLARQFAGQTEFNPTSERHSMDTLFEFARHELSHGADDSFRDPSELGRMISDITDPRYMMSIPEVRARAVARNYPRDMGKLDANRETAGIITPEGDITFGAVGREPYNYKIEKEIRAADDWGRNMQNPPPPTPPKLHPSMWNNQVEDTLAHYFGKQMEFNPDSATFDFTKAARLKPDRKEWLGNFVRRYGFDPERFE